MVQGETQGLYAGQALELVRALNITQAKQVISEGCQAYE